MPHPQDDLDHTATESCFVSLTPEEVFGLSWIIASFLRRCPRPLTPLQERLGGLVLFLRDQLPEEWVIPDPPLDRAG